MGRTEIEWGYVQSLGIFYCYKIKHIINDVIPVLG